MAAHLIHQRTRILCVLIAALVVWSGFCPGRTNAASRDWEEREVGIAAADMTLRGSLVLPAGNQQIVGVLLLSGSGPTDRDGNQPRLHNDLLRQLAHGLAASNIASLRADKRGVGGSQFAAVREQDLRFDDYAGDAARWVEFLRAQPRINSVFVIGHSEGALIAMLAAQHAPVEGIVSIAGAGFPLGTVLRRQIAAANLPQSLRTAAEHIIDELEASRAVSDSPPELAALFRPSVQPYLISQFRYDPAVEIAKLNVPILIMQGDRDLQISETDAKRLAAAAPQADLVLLAGVNHVLRDSPTDRNGNASLYNIPDHPLAAAVLPSIAGFIQHSASPAR
jgi:uncharacterized protein